MTVERDSNAGLAGAIGSLALGAAAMYLMDPDKGRRRRAIARDKALSLATHGGDLLRMAARDVQFRMQGLRARTRHLIDREDVPDDLQLIERVRAKLGRVCSHPHAVQVGANHGRVTLSGPILSSEVDRVLRAARSVRGVVHVEDLLAAHPSAGSVPSLQGGVRRSAQIPLLHDYWSPSLRVAALAGGTALALAGLRRGGVGGAVLAAAGALFVARSACNKPLAEIVGGASPTTADTPSAGGDLAIAPVEAAAPGASFDPYSH
ncbi:MAG TPA: BON domain-containing protein [Casimicrobiaceae bacterium]|nr:BON domain-containing protein [Casimicrobiaceae bacterium]